MNKISRQLIRIAIMVSLQDKLNTNKEQLTKKLEQFKDSGITVSELCEILEISRQTQHYNKKIIQTFLQTIGVNIVTTLEKSLNVNKENLRNKQLTIKKLCEILNINVVTYYRNKKFVQEFLKEIGSQMIVIKKTPLEESLDKNKENLRNKQLTIKKLCEILNIDIKTYHRNKKFIQEFLKEIGSQIIVRKQTSLKESLDKNKENLRNKQLTTSKLCEILNISNQTYYENKEFIQNFLKEISSQIIKEKSVLQNSFYEQVIKLPNVKIAKPEITINCETEANDTIENIIRDYENFQRRQNIAKNKQIVIAKNDQTLNVLMNHLNKYLNDLSKSAFDFYVETVNEKGQKKRYLIQCQGEQHYNLQSQRNNNPITRIVTDAAKMLVACKYNCNFIATYDVKAKKRVKSSLDVFNKFYMTTEEAIQLIKTEGTVSKYKIKSCAINMLNKIRNFFEQQINQLSQKIKKDKKKTNKEILEKIRKY